MGLFDFLKNKEPEQKQNKYEQDILLNKLRQLPTTPRPTVSSDEALSKLNRPLINKVEANNAKYLLSRKAEMKELQEMIHLHENPNNRYFDAKRQLWIPYDGGNKVPGDTIGDGLLIKYLPKKYQDIIKTQGGLTKQQNSEAVKGKLEELNKNITNYVGQQAFDKMPANIHKIILDIGYHEGFQNLTKKMRTRNMAENIMNDNYDFLNKGMLMSNFKEKKNNDKYTPDDRRFGLRNKMLADYLRAINDTESRRQAYDERNSYDSPYQEDTDEDVDVEEKDMELNAASYRNGGYIKRKKLIKLKKITDAPLYKTGGIVNPLRDELENTIGLKFKSLITKEKPEFMTRLENPNPNMIFRPNGDVSTHSIAYSETRNKEGKPVFRVYSTITENGNDLQKIPYSYFEPLRDAVRKNNYIDFDASMPSSKDDVEKFVSSYKQRISPYDSYPAVKAAEQQSLYYGPQIRVPWRQKGGVLSDIQDQSAEDIMSELGYTQERLDKENNIRENELMDKIRKLVPDKFVDNNYHYESIWSEISELLAQDDGYTSMETLANSYPKQAQEYADKAKLILDKIIKEKGIDYAY